MKETWTLLEETDFTGERLYQDEQGFVRMDLLPGSIREQIPHTDTIVDTATHEAPADPTAYAKLFTPSGPFTFYVLAFDGEDLMYCYVENASTPHHSEFGYVSLGELESVGDARRLVLPIERDIVFKPKPLSVAKHED